MPLYRHSLFFLLTLNFVSGQANPETKAKRNAQRATAGTCPCVRPPTGGSCIAYDSKFQASNLEEAVTNFVDLTAADPSEATNIFGQKPVQQSSSAGLKSVPPIQCKTLECVACFQALTERLTVQWAPVEGGTAGLGLGLSNLAPQTINAAPNIRLAQQCKRLASSDAGSRNRSRRSSDSIDDQASFIDWRKPDADNKSIEEDNRREKRDGSGSAKSGGNPLTNKGVSTPLDCSLNRGDPIGDNSGYVSLCNLCWSLRTLSSKYFPRYVNELSCHKSDKACLTGWGKCRERFRSIDVLYNSGTDSTPKWQQYSINSPISCECQVLSGSGLHNFVSH